MSKVIKRLNAYGMGGTFDQPGYEYDPVNDTFKDLETGKVFSKEYVAPTSGTGTGTVVLESNKVASIDVSQYTEPVEITPTSGKDGMEKTTITLNNIPSGGAGSAIAYCWKRGSDPIYFSFDKAPTTLENQMILVQEVQSTRVSSSILEEGDTYTKVSDTEFTISFEDGGQTVTETYVRDSTKDFTLWQANE